MSKSFLIGVDTGGTYTDAAVIEAEGHKVVASAKALTTKGDLALGVIDAIRSAIAQLPEGIAPGRIALASVSTTLATNAVVEGHGSPVGVILIGFDASMAERTGISKAFPGMPIAIVAGGHDHNGDARAPLDSAAIERWLTRDAGTVEAFAIASTFAVRNPAHEIEARDIVVRCTGKPATLSSELTSSLDAPRRALTAALNARLISRISQLVDAVQRALQELGVKCPLMVVKGDGSLARAEAVALRPIETIMSGPAASLAGARWLSGLDSFIMSDMGGTTTDLGVVLAGRPRLVQEGAEVGGWRTMVRAADVRTLGLGGDSEVHIALDGALTVGPQRITPLSLIGARYPETLDMLRADLTETEGGSLLGRFVLAPFGRFRTGVPSDLSARERETLALVTDRPRPLRQVAVSSGAQRALTALKRRGLVQIAGFTPSDAAHVLGLQHNWSPEAARLGAENAVRFREMRAPTPELVQSFAQQVWSETVRLSARAILDVALGGAGGDPRIVESVCTGRGELGLARISIVPKIPIVAVGGPVAVFYPEAGRRLGCEIVFPAFCDVANAVGAATGAVARSVVVSVEGDGSGLFRLHGPRGTESVTGGQAALSRAAEEAERLAKEAVSAMGGASIEVQLSTDAHYLPDAMNEDGLLRAVITAEAVGRPELVAPSG